jgi:hypothetical protein
MMKTEEEARKHEDETMKHEGGADASESESKSQSESEEGDDRYDFAGTSCQQRHELKTRNH